MKDDTTRQGQTLPTRPFAKREVTAAQELPKSFGHFKVDSVVGRGGMGVVYLAVPT